MVQDAPLSGVDLSVPFLVRPANEIRGGAYFKIETAQAAAKLRALIPTVGEGGAHTESGPALMELAAPFDPVALRWNR